MDKMLTEDEAGMLEECLNLIEEVINGELAAVKLQLDQHSYFTKMNTQLGSAIKKLERVETALTRII